MPQQPAKSQHTIVFDLDGTLVDTAPDLIAALNALFEREGIEQLPFIQARQFIGGGAHDLIEKGFAAKGRAVTATETDRLYADFVSSYEERIAELSRPFPGVERALDALAARDLRFAVCTNKLERLSVKLLDALGLSHRFAAICGPDTFGVPKPDPRVLAATVEAVGGCLRSTLMVGDSHTDVATARAANVPIIAVDFGYTDTPVAAFSPDRLISHFDELLSAVTDMIEGAPSVASEP
jgi:phosphoglycolate phosphatase